jgi:periplasmic protein TonB
MSRITLTAAAYGAAELKQVTPKYTLWALVIAASVHTLILLSFWISDYFNHEPLPKKIWIIQDPLNIPPPPSILTNPKGLPIKIAQAANAAKPSVGIPVPIPEAEVNPNRTFAQQSEMNPISGAAVEGIEGAGLVTEPNIVVEGTVEKETPPPDFVPFEKEPVVVKRIEPIYPELARKAGLEGAVLVKIWVNREGKIKEAIVLKSSSDIFNQPALDAAKQWLFTPALMKSGPVSVWVSMTFRFRLNER